jgi:CRISPR-associated protein Csb2
MSPILCITFRFIQPFPLFHGSGDAGVPEWPPSPMRAFQALVNATSLRFRGRSLPHEVESALATIESIRPLILAPDAKPSTVGYRAYVPHNQSDLVTAAWDRGNLDASIASHRMEKDIRPMRVSQSSDAFPALQYLYPLDHSAKDVEQLLAIIRPCVRSISALGWGIDQVVADASLLPDSAAFDSQNQRWQPAANGPTRLRVNRKGSLHALRQQHDRFLGRLVNGRFTPVPPITAFDVVRYARDSDPIPRPYAVFKLLDANEDAYRYPHAKLVHIAGMVRHVAIERMKADPPSWKIEESANWLESFVCGHRGDAERHQQLSYVPLPSIGHEHADAMIRNVILIAPFGCERELEYVVQRLDGEQLKPEEQIRSIGLENSSPIPGTIFLNRFTPPHGKFVATCYLGTSNVWHTVTPVILDGHNKKSKSDKPAAVARQTEKLIRKALVRAGIETPCEFTWQSIPFLKNCLSAHKYDRDGRHTGYHRPSHLKSLTAVHVRLTFTHPVPGPIVIGAGRHCGFGLFAIESQA